jgi:hypothetical protein
MQESLGVVERMDGPGRQWVRTYMPDQHREFFTALPFTVFGAVDTDGNPWATIRAGGRGFITSPTSESLDIKLSRDPSDPADVGFEDCNAIAMLGIQLETRRRNRMNGRIRRLGSDRFSIEVRQSFGNCPQYIQNRTHEFTRDPSSPAPEPPLHSQGLTERATAIITAADTFFVASYVDLKDSGRQIDVSHRGGKTGFVRVGDDGMLTVPDFAGNLFFNTLGNFLLNPRAGLLFVDFATGDMLQMAGRVQVVLASPEISAFQGAERLWRFTPERVVIRPAGLPMSWNFDEKGWSPNTMLTGDWTRAAERLRVATLPDWRSLRVIEVSDESDTVRSLVLEPADGSGLASFDPGQHLPIRVTIGGRTHIRRYTLSVAPDDGHYRISVRKAGLVSSYLHDLPAGALVEARAPAGAFTIDSSKERPVVMLAAGVGVTPMVSMIRHLVHEAKRTRRMRPVWLFQSARTKRERAFASEIASLVTESEGRLHVVQVLSSTDDAIANVDYAVEGRISIKLLRSSLPFDFYDFCDFYLCGPGPFMQSMYNGLRSLGASDANIHSEAFGASSLRREMTVEAARNPVAKSDVYVVFSRSGKHLKWSPESGSLLELAELAELDLESGCRSGSCGACSTTVLEGKVSYLSAPSFPVADGQVLICCAAPGEMIGGRLKLAI